MDAPALSSGKTVRARVLPLPFRGAAFLSVACAWFWRGAAFAGDAAGLGLPEPGRGILVRAMVFALTGLTLLTGAPGILLPLGESMRFVMFWTTTMMNHTSPVRLDPESSTQEHTAH